MLNVEDDSSEHDEFLNCVVESTGVFTDKDQAADQLKVSTPNTNASRIVVGENPTSDTRNSNIISIDNCKECIIHDQFVSAEGLRTTLHSITSTQKFDEADAVEQKFQITLIDNLAFDPGGGADPQTGGVLKQVGICEIFEGGMFSGSVFFTNKRYSTRVE